MKIFFDISKYRIIFISFISCWYILFPIDGATQELTPEQYFGDSYTEAITYYQNQRANFVSFFSNYNISTEEAIAVVFPEIIRFNRFRDFAETTALELAYVNGGKSIADFSIGHFQMKPSFVEMLEKELSLNLELLQLFNEIVEYLPNQTDQGIRNERIKRLKEVSWQLKYLACFIRLAEKRFSKELIENHHERLLIFSSAYNMGLISSYYDLKMLTKKKTFPYGKIINGRFSYFDVANYFYTHAVLQTQNSNP